MNECNLPPSPLKGGKQIKTVSYHCSPQSIVLSMQEGVMSSYNQSDLPRGKFRAKNRRVAEEILLCDQYRFRECLFMLGARSIA